MEYEEFLEVLNKAYQDNPKLVSLVKRIIQAAGNGTATFEMAQNYAIALGKVIGDTISETGVFSEEEPTYTIEYIANILRPALTESYELSSEATMMVQDSINKKHGINLKSVKPKLDTSRIDNMITEVHNKGYAQHEEAIQQQIVNFNQSAVDSTIRSNGDFLEHTGVTVRYTRIAESGACKWCKALEGTYSTYEAPDGFFGHHTNCQCIIKVDDMYSTGKVNYWTRKYDKAVQEGKIQSLED